MNDHEARALIDRQFEQGALPPDDAQRLREHLASSPDARAYYDAHVRLERTLEGEDVPDAQLARLEALGPPAPAEVLDDELADSAPKRRAPFALGGIGAVLAVAASVAIVALVDDGEVRTRGGPASGAKAWINVFAASGDAVRPLTDGATVAKDSGLLFSYSALRDAPFRYFAIAARDESGRVYWFHPAFVDDVSPQSLALDVGVADRELSERVFVDWSPGRARICAIFTREALMIAEVDARLERDGRWPDGAQLDCRDVEVTP
ncbi:MAG: hypothetical protein RIT81_06805 [Deltaproteobacteria bacterium]